MDDRQPVFPVFEATSPDWLQNVSKLQPVRVIRIERSPTMMNRKSNHPRHPGNQPTKNGGNHMETMKNHHVPARGISIGACGIRHLESAHFYTGVLPVSPCALRGAKLWRPTVWDISPELRSPAKKQAPRCGVAPIASADTCLLHSYAVRQAGTEKASPLSPSPSKGSVALAPLCGYPKVRMNVAFCDIHPSHHRARLMRAIHHEGGCCI